MSLNQDSPLDRQSPGCDPKTKRNSGLFAFLKWFKPSTSRESIDLQNSQSSSCDSLNSTHSNGTVASFSYVPPSAYVNNNRVADKCLVVGPETDTYKARLKQRDKRRENDKNVTLRKKYNLFFNRETFQKKAVKREEEEENTKSLPLMTRAMDEEEKGHRRTFSESSKTRKAGAYLHVKGKRKAPQPPGLKQLNEGTSTMSLRRKKRLAPPPPMIRGDKIMATLQNASDNSEIIFNDSLKLDHGMLRSAKETDVGDRNNAGNSPNTSARSSYVEAPVSPRPWYKRNNASSKKNDHKYEAVEKLPEVQFVRNSTIDLTIEETSKKKGEEKRKSGMSFLTNISELDREASEIVKKEHQKNESELAEIPQFMRPKDEPPKINTDSWVSPKRRSAKDLIAKFNAITNVTKVTVNTAFFGGSQKESKRDYFGKRSSLNEDKRQESLLETHKKRIEQIDKKLNQKLVPLAKSESASAIKPKPQTPVIERKSWNCPKCSIENDYWRIICHVCSAIKPYFDDLAPNVAKTSSVDDSVKDKRSVGPDMVLERSKTQIGFSALASYNLNRNKRIEKSVSLEEKSQKEVAQNKNEERERLRKMLIEMKNSLPKRKSNILMKQNSRASIIVENPDVDDEIVELPKKTQEEKVVEILVGTQETVYENIKVKKTDNSKPIKISAASQTQAKKSTTPPKSPVEENKKNNFELMRPKDFESIYSDPNAQSPARIYANLARNDELSLFFNMPKRFNEIKNNIQSSSKNTDTIEVNRLLRKLETSIAKGELVDASIYAKELAQLKINCSVIRQKPANSTLKKRGFNIEMYVEDKISHRGPFQIEVTPDQTVAELKLQVEQEFEIPANVQRWILGKELASQDNASLKDHHVTEEGCPVFLYLVAPENKPNTEAKGAVAKASKAEAGPSTSRAAAKDEIVENGKPVKESSKSVTILETHAIHQVKGKSTVEKMRAPKIIEVIPKVVEPPPKIEVAVSKVNLRLEPVTRSEVAKIVTLEPQKLEEAAASKPQPINQIPLDEARSNSVQSILVPEESKPNGSQRKSWDLKDENFDDYDTKTLKPQPKEWECHLCTLLNPLTSNVCAVCATVRQKEALVVVRKSKKKPPPPKAATNDATYLQLVNLDNADLVENAETFECLVCFLEIPPRDGVTLRECLHQFCKVCLAHTVEYTEDAEVKCPYRDAEYSCNIALQDREIKALVKPQVYENYLAKSVTEAENKIGKSFHCKTPDCRGWCIFEDNVNEFRCPVCRRINCLTCQAIHIGMNCKQYQEKVNQESEVDDDARRTKEMVEEMVKKGEALTCPTCQVILMKKWGCDWVRCSMCKTEICWVTRGPRWGPGGKGDTSGGCQCGVNGVKCHPQCSYCH